MKEQSGAFLQKAGEAMEDARRSLAADIFRQAARLSYITAFHCAQAIIFERTGKAAKTHKGVNAQFARIAKDEAFPQELSHFLASAYHFKASVDYELGATDDIKSEDAKDAFRRAQRFLHAVRGILEQ